MIVAQSRLTADAGSVVVAMTVWITLAERCPTAPDDQVLGAAAALAGMALGLA